MKPVQPTIVLVIALIVGAAGVYGGYSYRGSQITSERGSFSGRGGTTTRTGTQARFGGGRINGQIISADAQSMTIKLADGSSKIVLFSGQTMIDKATQGSRADLTSGVTVAVFGTTNSDGSVTAQNIQINPTGPSASPTGK